MAGTPSNSMNLTSTTSGLANWDGSATMSSTALTQFNVLSGASANTVNNITPSTAGFILTSNGTGAQPTFQIPAIVGQLNYYFTNTASSVAGELQQTAGTFSPKTTQTFAGLGSGNTLLETFITNAGIPNLSFLPAGTYEMHVHADQSAGTRNMQLYAEIWEASSVGADIALIGTTGLTTQLTGSEQELEVGFADSNVYTFGSTASRIKTKVFAAGAVSGSNATVRIFVGGTADSHTGLPGPTADVTNFVPYTGAVANVNLGTNTITASSATLTNALTVPNGGTGQQTLTNHGVLIGAGAAAITQLGVAATGTVLTGVTGADPAFSATPNVTSITFGAGNALSTYVQGTWTPAVSFGGGNTGITYNIQAGNYIQIGKMVFASFTCTLSNKGSSTGIARITGLPVTAAGFSNARGFTAIFCSTFTYTANQTAPPLIAPDPSTTVASLFICSTATGAVNALDTNFTNTTSTFGTLIYFAP